ncbi:MAG: hypothetical protein ACYCX3_01100 [Thermoleophilia bacterium]
MTLSDGRVLLFTEVAATMEPDWVKYQVRDADSAPEAGYVRSRALTEALRALVRTGGSLTD